jgi:hypothetical protein
LDSKQSPRRHFVKNASAFAGLAVGATRSADGDSEVRPKDLHAHGERSHFETSSRKGSLGLWPPAAGPTRDYGFRTPLQNSVGIITPASLHFVLSHGYDPPDIDPRQHRLMIHGMVGIDRRALFGRPAGVPLDPLGPLRRCLLAARGGRRRNASRFLQELQQRGIEYIRSL